TPTAYRNPKTKNFHGINIDGIFTTFIGSLWSNFKTENVFTQQIFFILLGEDSKWNFLQEGKYYPSLSIGNTFSFNLQGSGGEIEGKGGKPFGYLYGIMSKKWKKNAFHAGLMYTPEITNGKNERIFSGGSEIWNLISTKNITEAKTTKNKIRAILADTKYTIITGFNTSIFNKQIKIEIIYPLVNKKSINSKIETTEKGDGENKKKISELPLNQNSVIFKEEELTNWLNEKYYLINFYAEFFPFQFSYLKVPEGFSLIGYFSFRFNLFPTTEKEKK
ncbi:MAG: hypothetical protein ABIB46_00805, partial [bacterium]